MTTNSMDSCVKEVIRQIEKSLHKGHVEGVIFNSCITSIDDTELIKLTVPLTRVSVSGSGARWKSYGSGSESKIRK